MSSDLLLVLIGALIGGGATIAASTQTARNSRKILEAEHNNQHETQRRNVLREKGEEFFCLIEAWSTTIFTSHLPLYAVMKGEATYNDFLDHQISNLKIRTYDFNRFEMLSQVYFPSLETYISEARSKLEEHNEIVTEYKLYYEEGNQASQHHLEQFVDAQNLFENAVEALKKALASELRKI